MKKGTTSLIFIALTLVLMLSFVSAASSYNGKSVDRKSIMKCLKICGDENKDSNQNCMWSAVWENSNCRYVYKQCVFDLKNNPTEKSSLTKCKKEYTKCTSQVKNDKRQCLDDNSDSYVYCKGLCKKETCPDENQPVCGDDGITYANECLLRKSGVRKSYDGECIRNCYNDIDCYKNEFCKMWDGSCLWNYGNLETNSAECFSQINTNSNADNMGCFSIGQCIKVPENCEETYAPVCGCDGKTYSNNCFLEVAKASKAYEGECLNENCTQLGNDIQKEIDNVQKCSNDSECIIGFLGTPCNFLMCGAAYNTNADFTILNDLSDRYNKGCRPMCPMYNCIDPYTGTPKCQNDKCEIIFSSII